MPRYTSPHTIVKKQSASRQIIDYIIEQIRIGNFKTGDKLPNEREFSEMLGSSRISLREAISALSVLGILEARQGEGTFVGRFNADILGEILYTYTILDKTALDDLFDVRKMLESTSIKLSRGRITAEDFEVLRDIELRHEEMVDLFAAGEADAKDVFRIDYEFHRYLSGLPKNRFLIQFVDAICSSFDDFYITSDPIMSAAIMRKAMDYHLQILDALEKHNYERAEAAMLDHLEYLQHHIPRE